jgi:hypothetical protein
MSQLDCGKVKIRNEHGPRCVVPTRRRGSGQAASKTAKRGPAYCVGSVEKNTVGQPPVDRCREQEPQNPRPSEA